jgi:hypothetical protein
MAKKSVRSKSAPKKAKRNALVAFYHNHKTATHGLAAGAVLVLLKGLIAIVGIAVLVASVIAILRKHSKAK